MQIDIRHARPKIAIIIDDMGKALHQLELLKKGPRQITYSILPDKPYSAFFAHKIYNLGHEIMVHLPMEPINAAMIDGTGFLYVEMEEAEFKSTIHRHLRQFPHSIGVNNHMGSLLTTQFRQMEWLFDVISAEKKLFVDSRTTPDSIAFDLAYQRGMASAVRTIFIDAVLDQDSIENELRKLKEIAMTDGFALAIGHPFPLTIEVINTFLYENREIITLIPISRYVLIPISYRQADMMTSMLRKGDEVAD
jgi:polysaccharide deacetylase 2 family uncharacterized protein YibQ